MKMAAVLCATCSVLCAANGASAEWSEGVARSLRGFPGPVVRMVAPWFDVQTPMASFAMVGGVPSIVDEGQTPLPTLRAQFEHADQGEQLIRILTPVGTSFYGTGEVTGPLLRNGRRVELWNSDRPGYGPDAEALYQSHPWVMGVRPDGAAFGVLIDTTWRTSIDLSPDGTQIAVRTPGPTPPVYIVERPSPQEVCTALKDLTGSMPMPPRWALGYQQCRWSYFPDQRAREVARGFRDRNIPASVLWFDIDYMDGFKVFTFSPQHFPDPKALNRDLGGQGWKRVWMIDPGIKDEPGYFVRDQLLAGNMQVNTPGGEPFRGDVWPGPCVFPDFTDERTRAWWGGLYKDFMAQGIDGVWNDMNEPAVFSTPTKLMPEDMRHRGGTYRSAPASPPQAVSPGDHARFHNVYGMLMAQASYEGILAANPDKRPFVLTRANFLGGHRYAATWTGDNTANWTDLEQSIPMVLNLGLSGQPFSGPDIGGFNGNGPRDEQARADHFARWMGVGTMLPFARGHTAKGNINKEPWEFGPDAERACRLAIERRSRLLPYFYSAFYEAHTRGLPVARPAFFADPSDPALRAEDDVFLVGENLLVEAQLMPDRSRVPIRPKGSWRAFNPLAEDHPALPTLRVRPGGMIVMGPMIQFEGERPLDTITLVINLDEKGQASGWMYEDAGDGFGYTRGEYLITRYQASRKGDGVAVTIQSTDGNAARPAGRKLVARVLTDVGEFEAAGTDGETLTVRIGR